MLDASSAGLDACCILYAGPWPIWFSGSWNMWLVPASDFALVIFYLVVFGCSSAILLYYFIGANTTTIIPCASMLWHKIYTVLIYYMTVVNLILIALETTRTPCGFYAVCPPDQWDRTACTQRIFPVGQGETSGFGLALRSRNSSETRGWMDNEYRVPNVTGVSLVSDWSDLAQRAAVFYLASMQKV